MELRKFTSKLGVILLSVILITGISLVPTLQIGVQGQQHRTTPATSPNPTTPPTSTATTTSTTPRSASAPSTDSTTATTATTTTLRPITSIPGLDAVSEAANQTGGSGAANQSAMVMIPQSTMEMIMSNVQDAMTSVDSDNMEEAMMALESLDQELKSAANAAGMSVETTTDGGDASGDGDDDDGGDTAE
jgi:hypothetical protein